MNMTKVSLAGCLVAGITSVTALGAAFPDKNGSHDLTDPAAWDGVWPQTSNVRMDNGGTFNCNTQDATFTGIWPNAKNVVITNNPGRTITLNGSNILYPYNGGVTMELRGGTWNFSGKNSQIGDGNKTKFTLSGGVKILNCGTLSGRTGTATGDHALEVKDAGTEVTAASLSSAYAHEVAYNEDGTPDQTGVVIDVHDGARMSLAGFQTSGGWMLVRGDDTLIAVTSTYFRVGGSNMGCGLHVTDGAVITHQGTYLILQEDSGDYLGKTLVDNGGSLTTSGTIELGAWGTTHHGNLLIAGLNGTVQVGGVYGKNVNNWLVASNGTLTVTGHCQIDVADEDKHTTGIRIAGHKPKFVAGRCTIYRIALEWNLPDRPYETTGALIEAGSYTTSTLRYSINGLADFVKAIPETTEVVLMEATAADGVVPESPSEIARVNALLDAEAPGSRIYRTTDGKKLILHAKKKKGLAIIFR